MKSKLLLSILLLLCVLRAFLTAAAQESAVVQGAVAASNIVPSLINYSGILKDSSGRTLTSLTGVTFLLYKDDQGGAPLWLETQNVQPDKAGRFNVQLGAGSKYGIPPDLFMSGEARWLALQIANEPEQSRVILVAVPYAMKSIDAQTLGGLPPSAFMLATSPTSGRANPTTSAPSSKSITAPSSAAVLNVTTSGAAANVGGLPVFKTATDIEKSIVTQTGTTGISVAGTLNINGMLKLPALGTATASKGFNSRPEQYVASAFNGTSHVPVAQTFQWQAEATANNTATASATYNFLFGSGVAVPAETGLKIDHLGHIIFAAGQGNIPGAGTVTKVSTGAGLTGGPITATGTISIPNAGVSNAMLQHPSLTVTAGTGLTGGGAVGLGGATTLNLDTTKVPLLAAANTFTANQTVNGALTATSFSGNGASVTNVNAATLGGVAASGYPTLTGINNFFGFSDFFGTEPGFELNVRNDGGGYGIISSMTASSGNLAGVYASAPNSRTGIGLFGQSGVESGTAGLFRGGAGVWGDGGTFNNVGVLGTTDDAQAGFFNNNSPNGIDTMVIVADNAASPEFLAVNVATDTFCEIDQHANLSCTGTKNAIVPVDGGARTVALSAIESPENWFEDVGSAQLINGAAVVRLDAEFMQTVNTDREYQVSLTPYGDCKGLYVLNRMPGAFEVHELGGGSASLSFGYRITALRRKYEDVRFADHTRDMEHIGRMVQKGALTTTPHSHLPNENLQLRRAAPRAALTPTATKSQTR